MAAPSTEMYTTPQRVPSTSTALRDITNLASQPRAGPAGDDARKGSVRDSSRRKLGMPLRVKPEEQMHVAATAVPGQQLQPQPQSQQQPPAVLEEPLDDASAPAPMLGTAAASEPPSTPAPAVRFGAAVVVPGVASTPATAPRRPLSFLPPASPALAPLVVSPPMEPAAVRVLPLPPAAAALPVVTPSRVPAAVPVATPLRPFLPAAAPVPDPPVVAEPPPLPLASLPLSTAPAPVVAASLVPAPAVAAAAPAPMHAPVPVVAGGKMFVVNGTAYTSLEKIGQGGSSKVFRVVSDANKIFALKRVKLGGADPHTVASYVNEISLLQRLRGHDHIVTLFDAYVDRSHGFNYMVMECGEVDLARLLQKRQGKPLDENFVRYFWQQMLQAVQTVHDQRIVHSDLKPANFLLVEGTLKLIDFGIASAIQNDATSVMRENQVGTVNYMSPEALIDTAANVNSGANPGQQLMKVGRPSDVWSLGCILYQMVYGATPFAALQIIPKIQAIMDRNHTIAFEPLPNRELIDAMKGCLQRDPTRRITIPALLQHPSLHPTSVMP